MDAIKEIGTIISGFILLAIIAVLFSKNANTTGILSSFFGGVGTTITAAEAPVSSGVSLGSSLTNLNLGNTNY